MNDWMQDFISRCLADVPPGKYRTRTEKELRDHMETQRQFLTEAEILQAMGNPDKLCREYKAAWERSLQARLDRLKKCVGIWGKGLAVMFGVHYLIAWSIERLWEIWLLLPRNPQDPWVRLLREALWTLNESSFWRHSVPLALALTAGAFYLSRRFCTSPRLAWFISVGAFFYWAFIAAGRAWFRALDNHHRPFWEAVGRHFYYNAGHYCVTLMLCILLGILFGRKRERRLA